MCKIKKTARKMRRKLHRRITVNKLVVFLRKADFPVKFCGNDEFQKILRLYGKTKSNTNAFTVTGEINAVYVRDHLTEQDKIYAMLHESGHILLGHLDGNDHTDVRRQENEAEAFAYDVLHYDPGIRIMFAIIIAAILISWLCLCPLFGCEKSKTNVSVYITASGERYHRPSCGMLQGHASAAMDQTEARKLFTPCKICNP